MTFSAKEEVYNRSSGLNRDGLDVSGFLGRKNPDCTLKHRWIKEEWFVMPLLEATPHSYHLQGRNGCSSFHPVIQ